MIRMQPVSCFHRLSLFAATFLVLFAAPWGMEQASAQSRIKDIADFESVRSNMLVGYGLVVGLKGTGDDLKNNMFTKQSLIGMLDRLGVNARDGNNLKPKNVAAVMVTAQLPAYARQGTKLDVNVSSLGDASSLQGGSLMVTPLIGADGEVYSLAQGQVAIGGFSAQGQSGSSVSKGVPTAGRIANGGVVERELPFDMAQMETVRINLRNPDLTTSRRVARAINSYLGVEAADPLDPATVHVVIPRGYRGNVVSLLTDIEQLRVEPDQVARVTIDEQSGTVVMSENVRVSTVAVAQGSLTVRISETPQVSQPAPFSGGQTTVVPRTDIQVDEGGDRKLAVVSQGVGLQDLVNGLNALGVGPRDMITILQAIKASGALQAEIHTM